MEVGKFKNLKILILFYLLFTTNLFSSVEFQDAYKSYKADDFKKSLEMFLELAEDGDYDAAYILGYMYEHGEGCDIDMSQSAKWYKVSSKGYYNQLKYNQTRDVDKNQRKIYESIKKSKDTDTRDTIRQYTQSLYNIKAHKENYFLPISYRFNGTYEDTNKHQARDVETEFQVSLKFDFTSNLLGLDEIYSVAYTQLAFWQLYSDSAYFRETNYNPEFFITFPMSTTENSDFLKGIRVAFEHESNGRGGKEERSWNFVSSSFFFQYKIIFSELKLWYRVDNLRSKSYDYNPELIDYLGYGYLKFLVPYKKHLFELKLRHNFSDSGAIEASYTYPLFERKDLFLYLKGFSGYGESLIDYDNKVNKVGVGFSISR